MSLTPIIEIKELSTAFGDYFIHQDLNLTIYKREILAIVGGSGSGKTTLLRAILMLQPVVSGSIKIFGQEIVHCRLAVAKKLERSWGVLFQHGALFSSLTLLENVTFPLFEQTQFDKKTIHEIAKLKISLVGLPLDSINKYPAELSGGMQKRAALARAIVLDPQLLFLDEPTAGLDPQGASAFDELVISLKENLGLTIVMVTHDVDTLWRVTDRVAFIGDKKVQQVGSIEELFISPIPMVKNYFNDPRSKAARHIKEEV